MATPQVHESNMQTFLASLPKCEHHMHVEGSLEPELEFELAKRNNITLPTDDSAFASIESLLERYSRFTSLDDFLHYYFIGMSVLISAADFEALAYTYFVKAAEQGVKHAEIFFDPQAHTSRGIKYTTVVEGLMKAKERAWSELNLSSELTVCMLRHIPAAECHSAFESWLPDLMSGKVKGLGLSSTELGNHPSKFKQSYDEARANGIQCLTAHAGEEAGVDYMRSAVDDLGCVRVDHGIKLREDPDLLKRFARERILITMCPMSNVELRCVKHVKELPIREYLDAGVPFSLNSDDPAYFRSYLLDNYNAVQDAFNLTKAEWRTIATDSIMLSWCDDGRKQGLLRALDDHMAQFA